MNTLNPLIELEDNKNKERDLTEFNKVFYILIEELKAYPYYYKQIEIRSIEKNQKD